MNGRVVPPEIFSLEPWYLNFSSNMATVQFEPPADRLAARVPRALVLAARPPRAGVPRRAQG